MKRRHYFIIIIVVIGLIITTVFLQWDNIRIAYLVISKGSGIIEHFNSKRQRIGNYIAIVNGRFYGEATFKNGLQEGWGIKYYDSGQIENKKYYKEDKADGPEYEYYENGNLNYTVTWKNNSDFGSEYHYSEDKKILNYDAFGINHDRNLFFYIEYDKSQKISSNFGDVFSSDLYSIDEKNDSIVILKDKMTYRNLKELNVTVATPPGLVPTVDILINNRHFNEASLVNNTITVKDAFQNPGIYHINIKGKFLDRNNKVFKADSLDMTITKN